jgi:DNA-binding NarL/FixJ family response regulator
LPRSNPQAVLVMTHIEDTEVHRTFLRAGASEVLVKGVPFGEVLAAVRRLGADG